MSTAGPSAPGTMADNNAVGTLTWANVDYAKVDDGLLSSVSSSSASAQTHYLKATNFGFAIPSGATINGVTVSVRRSASNATASKYVTDTVVSLVKGGTVSGNNKADTVTEWPTTEAAASYGGAADLWGLTLADTDVNASTFGVVLSATTRKTSGKGSTAGFIDLITITIEYTAGAAGISIPVAMQSYRRRRV